MSCCGQSTTVQVQAPPVDLIVVAVPALHKTEIARWASLANSSNTNEVAIQGKSYPPDTLRFCEFIPDSYMPETQCFNGHFTFDLKVKLATQRNDFTWFKEKTGHAIT